MGRRNDTGGQRVAAIARIDDSAVTARRFDPDVRALREVRALVRAHLDDANPTRRAAAELLATELVTNVLRHAPGSFEVRVWRGEPVRVEVRDSSRDPPRPRLPDASSGDGRGMLLVARLSISWGAELLEEGKVVWFEL